VVPMVPIHLITRSRVVIANLLAFTIPASFFGMFFLLTLHMQRVLGYSPLQAGVAYLGFAFSVIVGVGACTKLVLKFGARALLVAGMTLSAIGLIRFANLTANGTYVAEILPGMVVLGIGGGVSMVTVTIFALGNLDRSESGLASGLLNASQQLGGALGLGCLMALANWRSAAFLAEASSAANPAQLAQLAGSHVAFYAAAAISASAAVTALICVPSGLTEAVDPTLAAAPEH
jgi:predicted MFS family arabinose efflux permease